MRDISRFHYITQDGLSHSHLDQVAMAVDAGLNWIQLRVKNSTVDKLEQIIYKALLITRPAGVKLIINDYLDLALSCGAAGVHLGQNDLSLSIARSKAPEGFIVGGTCNTLEQIRKARQDGAHYIGLGPYRYTQTKKNLSPILGKEGFEKILKSEKDFPVIAIGGLELSDFKDLVEMGAYGVALSSLVNMSNTPLSQMKRVKKEIEKHWLYLEEANSN